LLPLLLKGKKKQKHANALGLWLHQRWESDQLTIQDGILETPYRAVRHIFLYLIPSRQRSSGPKNTSATRARLAFNDFV
jgi:hypothetical protein